MTFEEAPRFRRTGAFSSTPTSRPVRPIRDPLALVSSRCAIPGLLLAVCLSGGLSAASADGADDAFIDALERRDVAGAVAQLEAGASPNVRIAHGKTALMAAAKLNAIDLVRRLLAHGAGVNARNDNGGTALMFAAIPGGVDVIALLIEHGADVNAIGHFNWTALMVAASKGHAESVALLLRHGADPNVQDTYGWTPLMRAVYGNKRNAAIALLASDRVDLEARDDRGATALHVAVERGHRELVAALIEHGADSSSTDDAGRGLLHKAEAQGFDEIASMLQPRSVQ